MPYSYRFTLPKYRVLRRHKRAILFMCVLLFLVLACYGAFAWYVSQGDDIDHPQTDIKSKNFNPLNTFKTPYFYFEADKTWQFVKNESSPNIFVYRSSKKEIVMRDLTVYVDTLPKDRLLTRILPVEGGGDHFVAGEVSGHCKDYLKGTIKPTNNNPVPASIESVSFTCQVDSTSNTVGIGQKGGSYGAVLTGESGKSSRYYLLYHDLRFTAQYSDFVNIVRSFHAI